MGGNVIKFIELQIVLQKFKLDARTYKCNSAQAKHESNRHREGPKTKPCIELEVIRKGRSRLLRTTLKVSAVEPTLELP